ncbi:cation:proton antiporter [Marinibaculum pumilum]|uniref:Cation:proton antiporter n=1 Tax=Marinibaculum pumilum TaxID=1766165 RepID=A0ABV7KTK5_9PROT
MHVDHQIVEITLVCFAASVLGIVMMRMRQPAMVGYILAGFVLGPSVLNLIDHRDAVNLLAELGVTLLVFFIGMELSLRAFRTVWLVAMAATAMQILLSVAAMTGARWITGDSVLGGLALGFCVVITNTAVSIRMLQDVGELRSDTGKVAVGLLVAQELAIVPMLLFLGGLSGGGLPGLDTLVHILVALAALAATIAFLSKRKRLKLELLERLAGDRGLLTLIGLSIAFLFAVGAEYLGLSGAFGAFLAGLIIGNSAHRKDFVETTEPVKDILLMVFFLSIGLLIDYQFLRAHWGELLLLLVLALLLKTVGNVFTLRVMRVPWERALLCGTVLVPIGTFSFVLGNQALDAGVIGREEYDYLVALIALSTAASPIWLAATRRIDRWQRRQAELAKARAAEAVAEEKRPPMVRLH